MKPSSTSASAETTRIGPARRRRWSGFGSLRTMLSALVVLAVGCTIVVAVYLAALTTHLHTVAVNLQSCVESVRIAHSMEVDLLLHARHTDPEGRLALRDGLLHKLSESRLYATTPEQTAAIENAQSKIETHLDNVQARIEAHPDVAPARIEPRAEAGSPRHMNRSGGSDSFRSAFEALEQLVKIDVAQAHQQQARASGWDRHADLLALGVIAGILVIGGAALYWLAGVFRPLFALAGAMQRFTAGDRDARAPVTGPGEIRNAITCFNDMAASLGRERDARLTFLAGVAHDLRNPLSALKLSTAMIGPEMPLPPESKLRRMLGVVQRQVTHLERMVGDFLDSSRVEAGQLELRWEERDARELIRNTLDLFESACATRQVDVHLPASGVEVRCDPTRIEQVLSNLISNALKYSPSHGRITISLHRSGGLATLAVSDEGGGIPAEERERLFEPFRRGRGVQDSVPGAGLGLYIVRRIVESHGGHIEVRSESGKGSTFAVHLPALPAQEVGAAPQRAVQLGS